MSAQAGVVARRNVTRFGRAPPVTKNLRKNPRTLLPQPHVKNLLVRDMAPCRIMDHYYNTLQDDLMYMTYVHQSAPPKQRQIRLTFDPNDPYARNRYNPPVGGSQVGRKPAPLVTPEDVIRLERIQIHTMVKEAIGSRNNLLPAIMAIRALTGETYQGGGRHSNDGIQIVKARKSVGGWLRPGVPVGVKVDLKGPAMYDFLGTLVDFVLPRIRDFPGFILPPASSSVNSPNAVSGVVSFGLPPAAMGFFPQIEVNQDSYPKMFGMHIHLVTNATGLGAQNRARALVSGFQIPFIRK